MDVLHQARPTATQMAALTHRSKFRAGIEEIAEARKIIPIICTDKPQAVQVSDETFGPRIPPVEEVAFGPVVHRKQREPKTPDIKLIIKIVSQFYDVAAMEVMSDRRTANIVRPRQISMYLAKTMTLKSLPEIGRRFGGRDHTTVLHAVRKIEGLVESDERLADEIEVLKLHIRQAVLNQ